MSGYDLYVFFLCCIVFTLLTGLFSVMLYAAAFTRLEGASEWTELVPLTKGTANANNYSGYGSANSFNTDTWESDDGQTIEALAQANA